MKKFNFKAFFLNHFEKMIFGVFALFVVCVLAKTSWSGYPKPPDQLLSNIEKVRKRIESPDNVWKDRDEFKVVDFTDQVEKIFSPLAYSRYEFSTPIFHPLFKKNEPRREPAFEAVMELTAKASLVALSMKLEADSATNPAGTDPNSPSENKETPLDETDELRDRREVASGGGTKSTRPGGGPVATLRGSKFMSQAMLDDEESQRSTMMPQGSTGAATVANSGVTSRGVRVVAVRGVFPLYKQADQFEKALHVNRQDALSMIEIRDFVLERQTAQAGPEPWKNAEWKEVNIDSALDLLNESSGVDPVDPVPIRLQDAVITMNLPLRLAGFWGDLATHPRLRGDELKNDAEIEAQNRMLDLLEETFQDSDLVNTAKPRRRGLTRAQSDVKSAVQQMKSNASANEAWRDKSSKRMDRMGGVGGLPNQPPTGAASMAVLDNFVTGGRYLLFRYLDFDVQSGFAYRYRVRLKLTNPNFDATDEELAAADPSIRKGEERDTPWSDVSVPVVVPNTVNYFLHDVGRDPYNEEKIRVDTSKPVAQLAMFDWDTKLGTTVHDLLNTYSIGSFISGEPANKKETLILDLTMADGQQLRKDKYNFNTSDVLLDVEPDLEITPDQHPDLKVAVEKGKGPARLGVIEEALVFTSLGEIRTLDPISGRSEEESLISKVQKERKNKEIAKKPDPNAATNPFQMGGEEGDGQSTRRRRSYKNFDK